MHFLTIAAVLVLLWYCCMHCLLCLEVHIFMKVFRGKNFAENFIENFVNFTMFLRVLSVRLPCLIFSF